jgi:cation:H+ antiporter
MDAITLVLFVIGLVLLIVGAEALVRGASRLATTVGISPLVVGLTVVAFGTSSPELAVGVQAAFTDQADITLGNIVGSNIANILLILGIAATITPLTVSVQLVRLEVPLMIALSLLVLFFALDGQLGRMHGIVLIAIAIGYTAFAIYKSRKETSAENGRGSHHLDDIEPLKEQPLIVQLGLIVFGLALLVLGSRWLVNGAVAVAETLGVSQLIIGLTVIAAGTSLPEIATSVIASLRGERDLAVGSVVGSNIFNLVFVLGIVGTIAPEGIAVPAAALNFDIPVMIAVALATLPIFFTGCVIARWEGLLFLGYYIAYVLYLILDASQHDRLPAFSGVMLGFVLPLTAITLLVLAVHALRKDDACEILEPELSQQSSRPVEE